jgi:hypothetical protein
MSSLAARNIVELVNGRRPAAIVNPEVFNV